MTRLRDGNFDLLVERLGFGWFLIGLSSLLPSASDFSPSFCGSKVTVERGWRKKLEPSDQVMDAPPSAQAKVSTPTSVSFFTGTEDELTLTVGGSPPT